MNKELEFKLYKAVEVSIFNQTGMTGLLQLIDSILYYEIKSFADEVMKRDKLDVATMNYSARHYFRQGYAKRHKEIHSAIIKALKARKPELLNKTAQLPQNTADIPHASPPENIGGGEVIEPSDNIT